MPSARRPSPLAAAVLSFVIPGAGQWYAGNGRRARRYLLITVVLVLPAAFLAFIVFYADGVPAGLQAFAITVSRPFLDHPTLLGMLLAANAALLMFRAFAVVDAFLLARGRADRSSSVPSGVAVVGLGFLLFLTAVPHQWVGERNLLMYDLFTHDFNADPGQGTTVPGVTTTSGDSTGTTIATTTSTTLSDVFPEEGRVNILLMGGDSGVDREGIRTDTMVVVSIDPLTGSTAMFSVPRNFKQVPLPPDIGTWWSNCTGCYPQALNLLYGDGLARPDLWGGPNSGANAAKRTIGYLLGLEIHYYALVNLNGFIGLIDAIGGIDMYIPEALHHNTYSAPGEPVHVLDIAAGWQHLDGYTALAYTRFRGGVLGDDFTRMSRQRCVLEALATQTDPVTAFRQLPELVPVIEENVFTDIPISALDDFLQLLTKFDPSSVVSVRIMPDAPEFAGTSVSYVADWTEDGFPIPDRDFIAERVAETLRLTPTEAVSTLNLQPIEDACGLSSANP